MAFTLLPAVDVADGRAARLVGGDAATATAYGPALDVARTWQAGGATWIHLVDLDAAFGRGSNTEVMATVVGALDVAVQLSGGVHDDASLAQALATGCARVVLSTAALADPAWCEHVLATHGEQLAVALDVRVSAGPDGSVRHRLAPRGARRDGGDLEPALDLLDRSGCTRVIVTDVGRDGSLRGPNVDLYRTVTAASAARVIASGGIAELADLVTLAGLGGPGTGLDGAVLGSALHEGRFTLPEALVAVGGTTVAEDRPPAGRAQP